MLGLTDGVLKVIGEHEPKESIPVGKQKEVASVLADAEYKEAEKVDHTKHYGDEYNTSFIKELMKMKKQRRKTMTDLERILSLANHGINKSPEARNTTKILKEAQEQINQLKESDAPEEMAEDIGKYVKQIPQFVKTLGSKSTTDKYSKDKDGKMSHTSTTTKHGHHNMEAYSPGDENEAGMVSNCCGAPIMDVHQGHGRCSDCKEMASAEREEEYYESTEEVVAEAPKLTVSFKTLCNGFLRFR